MEQTNKSIKAEAAKHNDFLTVNEDASGKLSITVHFKYSARSKREDPLKALGTMLSGNASVADCVKNIHYFGSVDWAATTCENIMKPCQNVVEIKSLTSVVDWRRVLLGKTKLKRLYLFASNESHMINLPTFFATMTNCPALEDLRIVGDSMPRHTKAESSACYAAVAATVSVPRVRSLAILPKGPPCNTSDMEFLIRMFPNVKELSLRIDSSDAECLAALTKCFRKWTTMTSLNLQTQALQASAIQPDFGPLTTLSHLETDSHLITPSHLQKLPSLRILVYETEEASAEQELVEHLKNKTHLPSLAEIRFETRNLEGRQQIETDLKALRPSLVAKWPQGPVGGKKTIKPIHDRAEEEFKA